MDKEKVLKILQNNGPKENEYKLLDEIIDTIDNETKGKEFRELIMPVLENDTIFGHTFRKPFGYAGDYLLIEKIYQNHESKDTLFTKWDRFYHSHEATQAVRNRKKFFINKLNELTANNEKVSVLILGSGPATDVYEFLSETKNGKNITFDLLDIDANSIEYATKKNHEYLDQINFIRKNVLRFNTTNKYDLIWSAGLFDYLDDKIFTFLLKRFSSNLKPNGQIIIGNFSPSNPTIKVMEIMTEWFLHYRDEQCLTKLALMAGIDESLIKIEKEPLGINLFLKIN